MEIFIIWLFLSIIAGVIASNKGRSGIGFFLLSVILSPLIGIIAALVAGANKANVEEKKISSGEGKKCPYCAEIVKQEAKICRYCNKELAEESPSEECQERAQPNIKTDHLFAGEVTGEMCRVCGYIPEEGLEDIIQNGICGMCSKEK